jgi:hypothetical protein
LLTGFMSNRGRQVVASFLVRDLEQDWREGAEHFEALLLDHDVCSNYGNWQVCILCFFIYCFISSLESSHTKSIEARFLVSFYISPSTQQGSGLTLERIDTSTSSSRQTTTTPSVSSFDTGCLSSLPFPTSFSSTLDSSQHRSEHSTASRLTSSLTPSSLSFILHEHTPRQHKDIMQPEVESTREEAQEGRGEGMGMGTCQEGSKVLFIHERELESNYAS